MKIGHNIMALNAYRNLKYNNIMLNKAMVQLITGRRINSAADDPAGLGISERMRAQIRGLNQAARNTRDSISLIQTAEGALNETHAMLQRIRELSVQATNGTYTDGDRKKIQMEIDELVEGIDDISSYTEFNGQKLISSEEKNFHFQIGANSGQSTNLQMRDMGKDALGIKDISVMSEEDASDAIELSDNAIKKVSSFRSMLGAKQNRLEYTINNLENASLNLQTAESKIRDADMAKAMMEYVRRSILQQVAQAMILQAMQQPQVVLQLLVT
ncbi:flagellin [Dethiothermospora halolimnae]|uniref:flagellin N-terminal helical domain-containing protein n=1 Tax=Dethiothermospora halolimnae TaxID=3114390 RepID=UPI003CCBD054